TTPPPALVYRLHAWQPVRPLVRSEVPELAVELAVPPELTPRAGPRRYSAARVLLERVREERRRQVELVPRRHLEAGADGADLPGGGVPHSQLSLGERLP